jgi:hypothetical protein
MPLLIRAGVAALLAVIGIKSNFAQEESAANGTIATWNSLVDGESTGEV